MISVHLQGKLFNVTVNKLYAPNTDAKEAEVKWFYEDLQGLELTRTNTKRKMSFSSHMIGMQKKEAKRYHKEKESMALEYKMKQGKG